MTGLPAPLSGDTPLDARMIDLRLTARSPEAHILVDRVLESVETHEVNAGLRQRARTQRASAALKIALAGILASTALSIDDGHEGRVFKSMNETTWKKSEPVGYDTMQAALRGLEGANLITIHKASCFYPSTYSGKAARRAPTGAMLAMLDAAGITASTARQHFAVPPPQDVVIVRGAAIRQYGKKAQGEILHCPDTAQARKIAAEVIKINEYLSKHEIRGGNHDGYYRSFNNGDSPAFSFNYGGRLYSAGNNSYQRLSGHGRLKMTIDGAQVCEVDIKACQLSLLHAVAHPYRQLPNDLYEVDGIPRPIVKQWVTATLGQKKLPAKWPRGTASKVSDLKRYPVKTVTAAMTTRYPFLNRLADFNLGTLELTALESDIIVATLLRLQDDFNVPALAMHDGIITKVSHQEAAQRVLAEEFRARMRVKPLLTVDQNTSDLGSYPT